MLADLLFHWDGVKESSTSTTYRPTQLIHKKRAKLNQAMLVFQPRVGASKYNRHLPHIQDEHGAMKSAIGSHMLSQQGCAGVESVGKVSGNVTYPILPASWDRVG